MILADEEANPEKNLLLPGNIADAFSKEKKPINQWFLPKSATNS